MKKAPPVLATARVLAAGAALLLVLAACASSPANSTSSIPGVKSIDMDRYLAKWYEISRIPVPVGRSWVNMSDTCSLRPDGSIRVVDEGCAWLVVTSSTKDCLWIMSRTHGMDEAVDASVVAKAAGNRQHG